MAKALEYAAWFGGKALEYAKAAVNVYVDFIQDWPGAVAIFWPVTLVIAAVYF